MLVIFLIAKEVFVFMICKIGLLKRFKYTWESRRGEVPSPVLQSAVSPVRDNSEGMEFSCPPDKGD